VLPFRVTLLEKENLIMASTKIHDYKGYRIEENSWDIYLGKKYLGNEIVFYITKGNDDNGLPILVNFLKKNGQSIKINSLKTAKRYISIFENKKHNNA
jgi:hypothetical protein